MNTLICILKSAADPNHYLQADLISQFITSLNNQQQLSNNNNNNNTNGQSNNSNNNNQNQNYQYMNGNINSLLNGNTNATIIQQLDPNASIYTPKI